MFDDMLKWVNLFGEVDLFGVVGLCREMMRKVRLRWKMWVLQRLMLLF